MSEAILNSYTSLPQRGDISACFYRRKWNPESIHSLVTIPEPVSKDQTEMDGPGCQVLTLHRCHRAPDRPKSTGYQLLSVLLSDPGAFQRLIISRPTCCHSLLIGLLLVSRCSCLFVPLPLPPVICLPDFIPRTSKEQPCEQGKMLFGT